MVVLKIILKSYWKGNQNKMKFNFTPKDIVIIDFDNTIWIWKRNILYGSERPNFLMKRLVGSSIYQAKNGFIPEAMIGLLNYLIENRVSSTYLLR